MKLCLDAGETVLYRLKKNKFPIVFMLVFSPVWLFFGWLFITPYFQDVFLGISETSAEESLVLALIGLCVFLPIVFVILFSYAFNDLIITNSRIVVRKGLSGRTVTMRHEDIRSFQHAYSVGKHGRRANNRILFYLYCGVCVSSNELYIRRDSLAALLEQLRANFEGRGFTRRELSELSQENPHAARPETKQNLLIAALFALPFVLALLAAARYFLTKA